MKTFSILSWNIQGNINYSGFTRLKNIARYLHTSPADIIALQEACDTEQLIDQVPALKGYFSFFPKRSLSSHVGTNGFNQNSILSKYPIVDQKEIDFSNIPSKSPLEHCSRTDIQIKRHTLRVYNTHFEIFRTGPLTRLKQLEVIAKDASNHNGPIIICGDLNTSIPQAGWKRFFVRLLHRVPKHELPEDPLIRDLAEKVSFYHAVIKWGFKEALHLHQTTWSPFKTKFWEPLNQKLDWLITKNLRVIKAMQGPYVSDHRPTKITCKLN